MIYYHNSSEFIIDILSRITLIPKLFYDWWTEIKASGMIWYWPWVHRKSHLTTERHRGKALVGLLDDRAILTLWAKHMYFKNTLKRLTLHDFVPQMSPGQKLRLWLKTPARRCDQTWRNSYYNRLRRCWSVWRVKRNTCYENHKS